MNSDENINLRAKNEIFRLALHFICKIFSGLSIIRIERITVKVIPVPQKSVTLLLYWRISVQINSKKIIELDFRSNKHTQQ